MAAKLKDIREVAQAYSDLYFHGALGGLQIRTARLARDWGWYEYPEEFPPQGRVSLNRSMDETQWRQVLLHEMVHAALAIADSPDEFEHGETVQHGPRFTKECNRIGRRLGLPDVTEDDSWAWPMVLFTPDLEPLFDD